MVYLARMIDTAAIASRFEALSPFPDERERRLFAASEARAAGRGGVAGNRGRACHVAVNDRTADYAGSRCYACR
jgi:hypothetical protein